MKETSVVGIVNSQKGGSHAPFVLHGLEKVPAEQLLDCLHYKITVFERKNPSSFLKPLRAAIDNFLVSSACNRPEDSVRNTNTLDFSYSISGPMAVLFENTEAGQRVSAFKNCCLRVSFEDNWCALDKIMGRNAHMTKVQGLGGNIFEAGGPVFKMIGLPLSKITMTLRYAKLLTPGATATVLNNQGSSGARREFRAGLREPRLCYFCLRIKRFGHATHLCTCNASDDSEEDHIDDIAPESPSLLREEAVPCREPPPPPPPPPPLVAGALAPATAVVAAVPRREPPPPPPPPVARALAPVAAAAAQPVQVDLTMDQD